jgi:hypothetical protein
LLHAQDTTVTGELTVTGQTHLGSSNATVDYPNADLQIDDNTNDYAQVVIQNHNAGTAVSADYVATAPNGTDTTFYTDLGILGNNYNTSTPNNSLGTAAWPNDGYLYVQGNTSVNIGGNLVVGAATPGRNIVFIAGGVNAANVVATAKPTGWTIGNIGTGSVYTDNYFYANGVSIFTGITTSINNVSSAWQANAVSQQTQIDNIQANLNLNYATTLVTAATYTASATDYYIGVNRAGTVTITLPSASNGNMKVIKDESGAAATNPITIVGTIDNQANVTLQINNAAITLIYRNGWRII